MKRNSVFRDVFSSLKRMRQVKVVDGISCSLKFQYYSRVLTVISCKAIKSRTENPASIVKTIPKHPHQCTKQNASSAGMLEAFR